MIKISKRSIFMLPSRLCVPAVIFFVLAFAAQAQVAVKGETVWTMAGEPIKDGVVLVKRRQDRSGRPASQISIPAGYRTISAKVVTPV